MIVHLSDTAYVTLCGLVQPSDEADPDGINHQGIMSEAFTQLRILFPLSDFQDGVERGLIEYHKDAGT